MNLQEFKAAVIQDGGELWDKYTPEELNHAIRETVWCGESGFEAQGNFHSWQWFPSEGWSVQCGRGVTGCGPTLESAKAQEESLYNESFKAFVNASAG